MLILLRLLLALGGAFLLRRLIGARIERGMLARLPLGPDGIITGAEPITLPCDTNRAVLILHGFADTPQTVRYLADHVHALGFTVRAPLLPGHGRTLQAFSASGAEAWLSAADREIRSLRDQYESVGLVGLSMGGALAVILAARTPAADALVLIAPYLSMRPRARRLAAFHWLLSALAPYLPSREDASIRDEAERASNRGYGVVTPRLLRELWRVVVRGRQALPDVRVPTLVIQSRADNRIEQRSTEEAFAMLGAARKRLAWTEGGGHVITVDTGREQVLELTSSWLVEHMPSPSSPAVAPGTD